MRIKHCSLTVLFFIVCFAYGQNPLTIVAPKYINQSGAFPDLPLGPTSSDYQGQSANHSSNAYADPLGNLKFFIVDDQIYDYGGYLIGDLSYSLQSPNSATRLKGRSEVVVAPIPNECEKFYIISIGKDFGDPTQKEELYMYILDFTQTSVMNATRDGALYSWNGSDMPFFTSGVHESNGHLALTKPRSDGSYFLFYTQTDKINLYRVSNTGPTLLSQYTVDAYDVYQNLRAEMEVIEMPDPVYGTRYRIAAPFLKLVIDPVTFQQVPYHDVFVVDVTEAGTFLNTTIKIYAYPYILDTNGEPIPFIHGLEFDKTGKQLFIAHTSGSGSYTNALDYVLPEQSGYQIYNITNAQNTDFQSSQIERFTFNGVDALYMLNETKLGRIITDDNTPSAYTFQPSIFNIGVAPSYMGYTPAYLDYNAVKLYMLPDQIDGFDYHDFYVKGEDATCCKLNIDFNVNAHNASNSTTWTVDNNELEFVTGSNVATIRDELRIKKGTELTITGMELRFAPGAKLIIESGNGTVNGGRLILNGTKLTVDERCSNDLMWEGIEVHGYSNLSQGTIYSNSQQGRLIIQNNSIIEYAKVGVVLARYDSNIGGYSASSTGGVLVAKNSIFRNNQRDVIFRAYASPNGQNNFSSLVNCQFLVTETLRQGLLPMNHVELLKVKGVYIGGCDFSHTNAHLRVGNGVFSTNSVFNVKAHCNSMTVPCTSYDPNNFENLNFGIWATNVNSTATFGIDRNNFTNNNIGVRANNIRLGSVTRNNFKVFESTTAQTDGIYFTNSTKYVIEENNFGISNATALTGAKTYGIVISNSLDEPNMVYKNFFTNLFVGGQSELVNSNNLLTIPKAKGLVWKCNTFKSPIASHDLTVMNGSISFNQGLTNVSTEVLANQYAANNDFSLLNESTTLAHDFLISNSNPIHYVYIGGTNYAPDSYTQGFVTTEQTLISGNPVTFYPSVGCPSRLGKGKVQLNTDLMTLNAQLTGDVELIESGASATLLASVQTGNIADKLSEMMAASPYVSDEILIAYLNRTPPSGDVLDVILENSPVSAVVKSVLDAMILPSNIRNAIYAAQTSDLSPRTKLELEILTVEEQVYRTVDDLLREVVLDSTQTRTYDDLIPILNARDEQVYKELLVGTQIARNDSEAATAGLTDIASYQRTDELNTVLINMMVSSDESTYLDGNSDDLAVINSLSEDTDNPQTASRAMELLILAKYRPIDDSYSFIEEASAAKQAAAPVIQSIVFNAENEYSIYPNPFKNEIRILTNKRANHQVVIYDLMGSVVFKAEMNDLKTIIQLDGLKNGIYLLSIYDEGQHVVQTNRIVKE